MEEKLNKVLNKKLIRDQSFDVCYLNYQSFEQNKNILFKNEEF